MVVASGGSLPGSHSTALTPEGVEIERLRRRVVELTAAVEARDTFIAIAAHELRNPMMPIIGQIDLLRSAVRASRNTPKQIDNRLERLQQSMGHFVARAGILLDVSRINSGRLQLALESCDIAVLLHGMAADFADAALHAGVAISVTAPDRLLGICDRLALEQIIDNLISNAIKYGSGTPVEISAELRGERVSIHVRDHGSGIPADDRERVFGCFERTVGRTERRSGFGVGLWVVRQLTEAMGGMVAVGDTPGGGASFTVHLPQHPEGTRL
jgi:two-component system, OmpR family, sensor kinase